MKKCLFLIFFIIPVITFAQTMCVRDNSLVISLDVSIIGTGSGANASESIWWGDFPYGRIYGESTCLSLDEGLGQTTSGAYYGTDEYANTLITAEPGLSGSDINGNERTYCWCRMTHPATSAWTFKENAPQRCSTNCAVRCARDAYTNHFSGNSFRVGLFKTIGM